MNEENIRLDEKPYFSLGQGEEVYGYVGNIKDFFAIDFGILFTMFRNNKTPATSLIITNKRILFYAVPRTGSGMIDSSDAVNMWTSSFAPQESYKILETKINELKTTRQMTIGKTDLDVNIQDIESVSLKKGLLGRTLTIFMKSGEKRKYTVLQNEDYIRAQDLFTKLSFSVS